MLYMYTIFVMGLIATSPERFIFPVNIVRYMLLEHQI